MGVMLCDSRDVVVQSDVFEKIDQMGLVTGQEAKRIGECSYNQMRISQSYGRDVLRELWDEWIICSGVSLGPRKIVLEYVDAMIKEFNRIDKYGIMDQPTHNYLIRTKALNFPVHITTSADAIIA